MAEGDVIRAEDGRKYRMGRIIKAGLIGIVYAGTEEGSSKPVAIKIPVPNLSADAEKRFNQEYDVLKNLADQLRDRRYVPWVFKGRNETSGEEALVMEYVGEDRLLSTQLPSPDEPDLMREKMAIRAASQYARLLEALHACNYTCQDRKLTDLRWMDDVEGGRLVVLDWNVVGEGDAQQADDIYLFGVLWYQLLAGRYPTAMLNSLDDSLWREGKISYGTRRLLLNLLSPNSNKQFKSAQLARRALQQRTQTLEKPGAALLDEANPLYETLRPFLLGRSEPNVQPNFDQEWQALDLFDLAHRQDKNSGIERSELLRLVKEQGNRLVKQVEQAFRISQYDQGEKLAQEALRIAEAADDSRLKLNVARWQLLIQAGLTGLNQNILLRKMGLVNPLAEFVNHLQNISPEFTVTELHDRRPELQRELAGVSLRSNTETDRLLQELDKEIEIYQLWLDASALEEKEDYVKAGQQVEALKAKIGEMTTYGKILQSVFPQDLSSWQKELAVKAHVRKIIGYWEQEVPPATNGKPYYLEYLLAIDLRTRLAESEDLMSPDMKATLAALPKLSELYRCRDYAVVDPHLWSSVVEISSDLAQQPDIPLRFKEEAEKYRQQAQKIADIYFQFQSSYTDEIALKIYSALQQSLQV